MSVPTYWQWIPSITHELSLARINRIANLEMMNRLEQTDACSDVAFDFNDKDDAPLIHCEGAQLPYILHDYCREKGLETIGVTVLSATENSGSLVDVTMSLECRGLLSVRIQNLKTDTVRNPDAVIGALIDSIVSIFHSHAHPRSGSIIGCYKGVDRSEALKWICDAYEERLVSGITNYRNNPKEPTVYFDIKSCVLYGKSFLEKYGDCLGDGKDDLEYICRYADESADHTYLSREYRMNHGASENMASMNNRMFILMMLSIAMSFFAGSIFNEAIGGMSRPVWTIAGAVVFIAVGYFGLRYARKRSEKEKDGLYKERSCRNHPQMTLRRGAVGPHIISTRPGIINTWRVQRRPLLRPSS